MTQLLTSWLNEEEMERVRLAEVAAMTQAEKRAERERLAAKRMAQAVERWGLGELLDLSAADVVTDEWLYRTAQITLGQIAVRVYVHTSLSDWGNIRITLQDAEMSGIYTREEWSVTVGASRFKVEFLQLARHFLAKREPKALRLPQARKLIQLAKLYEERKAVYVEMRRQWAERWTKELWAPWVLWRVWYLPVYGKGVEPDEERGPEAMMCLEQPETILAALAQFPTATVHRVETDGAIVAMEIPSFVEAEPVALETLTIGQALAYHRTHRGLEVVVNVPAIAEREPEPAPRLAPFTVWLQDVDESVAEIAERFEAAEWDVAEIAALAPEDALGERCGWLFD